MQEVEFGAEGCNGGDLTGGELALNALHCGVDRPQRGIVEEEKTAFAVGDYGAVRESLVGFKPGKTGQLSDVCALDGLSGAQDRSVALGGRRDSVVA